MNKIVSLVLLVGGIALIVSGAIAADSLISGLSRLFTGAPTDKSVWLLVGGFAAAVIGLSGLAGESKTA